MIAGRPQNFAGINVRLHSPPNTSLDVYACCAHSYERSSSDDNPRKLFNVASNPDEISEMLKNWIKRDSSWESARSQFFSNFRKGREFDIGRLIGAANMFDILPDDAFPPEVSLSGNEKTIKSKCKELLQGLPKNIDTSTILSDLSRLGSRTLKQKIKHRADIILREQEWELPSLYSVIDESVNCRNHFVHGAKAKMDYHKMLPFFTSTLEFVFSVSAMIESGWKTRNAFYYHPFKLYIHGYKERLRGLFKGKGMSKRKFRIRKLEREL